MRFWSGFVVYWCLTSMARDLRGQEGFIASVRANWVNTPWWIWPLPILVCSYMGLRKRRDA